MSLHTSRAGFDRLRLGLILCIALLVSGIPSTALANPSDAPHRQPTEGLFQNDHFAVVYSGEWVFFSDTQASGGSFDYTTDDEAAVSFQFNATSITIYRSIGPTRAIMRILIDGTPYTLIGEDGLVDNYASSVKYAEPLRILNLTKAVHTIEIQHTGQRNPSATNSILDIDALEVKDITPVEDGTYQNSDPAVIYAGTWNAYSNTNANGGSVHYTDQANASARLVFTGGNAVHVGYTKDRFMGMFDIYLDGGFVATVDAYSATSQWQVFYLHAPVTADDTHVVEMRVTHTKNPSSNNYWIYLDWFDVIAGWTPPPNTPVPPAQPADKNGDGNQDDPTEDRYENTDPNITYFGEWTAFSNTSASGGSVHYSSATGGSVASMVLQGGDAIEIGYTTAPYLGIFEVWVDGTRRATIDSYGPVVWQKTYIYYQVTPLQPHIVEIKATGGKNTYSTGAWVYLDWIKMRLDYEPTPPPSIPPLVSDDGRYEDHQPNWQRTGAWTQLLNNNASGINTKSVHYTNEIRAEAKMPVQFSTTGLNRTIEIGYATDTFMGIFEIYVDGELKATIDAYGPTAWQKEARIYFGTTIASGVHMVTVRCTGAKNPSSSGKWIYLDWIRIYNDLAQPQPTPLPAPVANGTYEDTHEAWWWEGAWTTYTTTGPSGESVRYTNVADDTANIRITNADAVAIGYAKDKWMGIVEIYVDGTLAATVDAYNATSMWRVEELIINLTTTVHQITIRHTGTKNPSATNSWFYVDYIKVYTHYVPPTATSTPLPSSPSTYQDNHSAWVYHGTWVSWDVASASGGTAHYSKTSGDIAGITVTGGSGIELGYMEAKWAGIAEIYIDGVLVDTVDAYNTADTWNVKRTYALTPAGTAHTLDVRITGNKNVLATNSFFIIDYVRVLTGYTPPIPTDIVYTEKGNRYETDDPEVTLSRSWILYNSTIASGGKMHYTNWSGATVSIAFNGLWVTIGYWTGNNYGMFDIYIDGEFVHRVDGYTANQTTTTYTARAQTWGQHILEIRTPGLKNALSNGYFTSLDYFDIVDVVPTPIPTNTPEPTPAPPCYRPADLPAEANNTVFVGCYITGGGNGSRDLPFPTIAEALITINDQWISDRGIAPGTPIYIYVMPGTYALPNEFQQQTGGVGSLTFNAPYVHLVSTNGRAETVIDGFGLEAPVFDLGNYSNLMIDGFMIVRGDQYLDTKLGGGIYVHGGSVYIVNNEFWGNEGGAIGVTDAAAFIDGNIIHHNRSVFNEGAITARNILEGTYARNNEIYLNTQTAIRLVNVDSIQIERNFIFDNEPPEGRASALDAALFASATLRNNVIYDNKSVGASSGTITIGENPVYLVNNTIANNNDVNTILFTAVGSSVLLNNAITSNGGTAVNQCLERGAFLFNNNIWDNGIDYGTNCFAGTNGNVSVNPYYYDPLAGDYHIHVYDVGMRNRGDDQAPGLDVFAPERDFDDFWSGTEGVIPRNTPDPTTLGDARDVYGNPDIGADEVHYDPVAVTPTRTLTPVPSSTPSGAQVGTHEENSIYITYYGDWARYAGSGASGGYAQWTKQNGARLEMEVAANKITIYYGVCPGCGPMRVRLDGNLVTTLNTLSATTSYGLTYTIITSPSSHILELTNMDAKWIGFDAVVLAEAVPITAKLDPPYYYDDNDPNAFLYASTWSVANGTNALGGSFHYATNTSASVVTYFYGRGFTLYYYGMGPGAGKFEIWVDGTLLYTVDQYAATADFGYTTGNTITFSSIGRGNHLLEIRHAGKNPASKNYYIYIDALEILP